MNVLERVFTQGAELLKRDINSLTPAGASIILGSLGTASGKTVTPIGALGLTTVYHAVDLISQDYGSLPYKVFIPQDTGKEILEDHNVNRLLNFEPNYYQTPLEYHRMMAVYRLLFGNAYAIIERSQSGQILNLLPVHPDHVINITEVDKELFYNINLGDNSLPISGRDMIHVKDLNIENGINTQSRFKGKSRIAACSEAVGAGLALRDYTSTFFGNGANIGTVIESEVGAIQDDAQRKSLENSLAKKYTGPDKSFSSLVLPSGYKLSAGSTKFNQQQSQFIETRIHLVEEIAQIFNLPLSKMRTRQNGVSHNSQEQSNIEYVTDTLRPFSQAFDQEYTTKLFSFAERFKILVQVSLESRLRGDMAAQTAHIDTMIKNGVYSVNQALRYLGQNTIGKEGDMHMIQSNQMELGGDPVANNEEDGKTDN